jgi:hypothetical protein
MRCLDSLPVLPSAALHGLLGGFDLCGAPITVLTEMALGIQLTAFIQEGGFKILIRPRN